MINQPIDAWFWILVGFAGGIVTIGLLCLSLFAFANWRRKVIDANADRRIVIPLKHDG